MTLQSEWLEKRSEDTLPRSLQVVRADIIWHTTPLEQRRMLAGTEQFRQEGHSSIPISVFAERIWESHSADPARPLLEYIVTAVCMCGYRRPDDEVCY